MVLRKILCCRCHRKTNFCLSKTSLKGVLFGMRLFMDTNWRFVFHKCFLHNFCQSHFFSSCTFYRSVLWPIWASKELYNSSCHITKENCHFRHFGTWRSQAHWMAISEHLTKAKRKRTGCLFEIPITWGKNNSRFPSPQNKAIFTYLKIVVVPPIKVARFTQA